MAQLQALTSLPWIAHLSVMPDVHYGIGATVGSVIGMRGAVCPAAVGVDIGCGMTAVQTSIDPAQLPDKLVALRARIEEAIPVGFNSHNAIVGTVAAHPLWADFPEIPGNEIKTGGLKNKALVQCGTLGGGNHFIELCVDSGKCPGMVGEDYLTTKTCKNGEADYGDGPEACIRCGGTGLVTPTVWMMLHSGSRGVGNELAKMHMEKAAKLKHNEALKDPDLASFLAGTIEMTRYRRDLYWAQQYAKLNRLTMMALYTDVLRKAFPLMRTMPPISCHHNYLAEETHFDELLFVTRKGAIEAGLGTLGIIPGSMGTRSYIVRGLGNVASLNSASHGAGRRMSRGEARRRFKTEDLIAQTAGVECRKDEGVLDEIPGAYKDIDQVMTNQSDLV
ncbi:MAG: RtcB family protein, partial [Salinibacterium sp.]